MYAVTVTPFSKKVRTSDLTYFTAKDIALGMVVSIAIRKKIYDGIVTQITPVSSNKEEIKGANFQLRKIERIKGPSQFHPECLALAQNLSAYYFAAPSTILGTIIPQSLLDTYALLKKQRPISLAQNNSNVRQEKLIFQANEEDRLSWYKTFIRESFAKKRSLFIIVPTLSDIYRFSDILSKGIEKYSFIFHGDLTPKNLVATYNELALESHPVLIIGTPQFLSLARNDIGAIIIEHESSNAYKSIHEPHLDFRLFAELLAEKAKYKFILGDTLLRVETLHRYYQGEFTDFRSPTFHLTDIKPQEVIMIRKQESEKQRPFTSLTSQLQEKVTALRNLNNHLFLFTLRNGLSTLTSCRDCGSVLSCEYCGSPLVLYKNSSDTKRTFICNKCKRHKPSESKCATCGSWNLYPQGIGIEFVSDELKTLFPDIPVFRIDRDSVKTPKQGQKIIADFYKTKGSILLGTELALSYISEPVSVSGVVSFDSLFNIPSFRMNERILHLMLTIHTHTKKEVIVQTRNEDDTILPAIASGSLLEWYRTEVRERERFNYPPFSTIIKVTRSVPVEHAEEVQQDYEYRFSEYQPDTFKGFISTNRKGVLVHMVLRISKKQWSLPTFGTDNELEPKLAALLNVLRPEAHIEIDPEDLL